jgi:hypothetical protein
MSFDAIYAELCEQHGAVTTAHKAIVRRIAALLAADDLDRSDAATIASLTALLPAAPGKAAEASGWPLLFELSEDDFGNLISLACRAGAFRCPEGGSVSIAPLPAEALVARAGETIEVLRRDLADTKAALAEVSRLLVEARAGAAGAGSSVVARSSPSSADIPPAAISRASRANVVRLRSPAEADDCRPLDRVSDYSFLDAGTPGSRFDNAG